MDTNDLMDELARRGEAGDGDGLAALCSPDLVFTQNTGLTGGIEALTALVEGLNELGISVAYSNIRRLTAGDVVVEQRLVTLNRKYGARFDRRKIWSLQRPTVRSRIDTG